MMNWLGKIFGISILNLLVVFSALAQDVSIDLGPDEIALNQAFTITVTVSGESLKSYDKFPEIEGFIKRGTSSSSSTNIFNGNVSRSQSITQNYVPQREGTYSLKPFTITVNGKSVSSAGKTIKVTEAKQRQKKYDPFFSDPFEDFFGKRNDNIEFVDLEDEAFLAVTTDKNEVYVGEGVNTTLAFYVAESNRAPLQFYDLTNQLNDILKKVRPENVWEENFNIENIVPEPVTIKGKRYSVYKIFQASFFPLNEKDIVFPSVGLKMIKYKVAKSNSFFGQRRMEDYKTYYSKEKRIKVKPLPDHPLKDQVSVGSYSLIDNVSSDEVNTGESFQYGFQVSGEGNISSINQPKINQTSELEIYPPNSQENIKRSGTTVRGNKVFNYYGIPKEPGTYNLGDYFQFIYFDPQREQYDTLRSIYSIKVGGESLQNEYIASNTSEGLFYDRIEFEDNTLSSLNRFGWLHMAVNIFLVVAVGLTLFILLKKS